MKSSDRPTRGPILQQFGLALCAALISCGCTKPEPIRTYEATKTEFGEPGGGQVAGSAPTAPEAMPGRMLVALVEHESRVWFIKFLGPEKAVADRANEFRAFIDSVEFKDGKPKWELPARWKEQPGLGMRYATINTGQPRLDISVISLPSPQDVLQNVNRWRGQLQQQAITDEELSANVKEVKLDDATATLIDIVGKIQPQPQGGMAPPFARGGPEQGGPMTRPPATTAASGTGSTAAGNPGFTFTQPDGWKSGRAGGMRKATFIMGDGKTETTVIVLGAGGAKILPNVNRWRGQVGLPPTDEDGLAKMTSEIDVGGITSTYINLVDEAGDEAGDESKTAMLAVITVRGDAAWYFKLMGDSKIVAAEKENFEAFVGSVKF